AAHVEGEGHPGKRLPAREAEELRERALRRQARRQARLVEQGHVVVAAELQLDESGPYAPPPRLGLTARALERLIGKPGEHPVTAPGRARERLGRLRFAAL